MSASDRDRDIAEIVRILDGFGERHGQHAKNAALRILLSFARDEIDQDGAVERIAGIRRDGS